MITQSTRRELLRQSTSKVFCNILEITIGSETLRYADNNEALTVRGEVYQARGFSFSPPDPAADDATASVSIEDVDRLITGRLQECEGKVSVSIALVRADDADTYMDGPYDYELAKFSKGTDGMITLEISARGKLGYNASSRSYSASSFPGLFG